MIADVPEDGKLFVDKMAFGYRISDSMLGDGEMMSCYRHVRVKNAKQFLCIAYLYLFIESGRNEARHIFPSSIGQVLQRPTVLRTSFLEPIDCIVFGRLMDAVVDRWMDIPLTLTKSVCSLSQFVAPTLQFERYPGKRNKFGLLPVFPDQNSHHI